MKPSPRQIVFNWLFDEDLSRVDGYWGGSDEVRQVDELLAALGVNPVSIESPQTGVDSVSKERH